MRHSIRYLLSLAAGGLVASCGYTAPYQTSGPVAQEGVQIALAGERCYVNRSGEQFPTSVNDDQLHVDVQLNVVNRSDQVAVLDLDALQLEDRAAPTPAVIRPMESGSVELAPGETRVVPLAFSEAPQLDRADRLDCHHELALDTQHAVAIGGQPLHLAAIHFRPAR